MSAKESVDVAVSSDQSTEPDDSQDTSPVFYPAYCYKASPTWFTWVKLTAYDIHNKLRTHPEFHAEPHIVGLDNGWVQYQTLLLFYLNHPIQFVQLIGVIVTFEDYFEKFWLFALDDSSGATIEVNCRKPEKRTRDLREEREVQQQQQQQERDVEAEARWDTMGKLDIGAVVQVKGLISTFRDVRQLQLERISLIKDTNHELRLVAARGEFRCRVLNKPWRLTEERQKALHRHALGESRTKEERARKRRKALQMKHERDQRHAARIAKEYEREERRRRDDAEEARRAGQLLKLAH